MAVDRPMPRRDRVDPAFDGHAARRAIDPSHRVDEEHRDVPERHKLEPSRWKPVVPRPLLATSRADRPAVGPGLDIDLELRLDQAVHEADLPVDETLVPLDPVENTLEMHPAVAPAKGLTKQPHLYRTTPQDASFSPRTARQGGASRRRHAAVRRLPPRRGWPHQAADAATPCPRSAATRRTEGSPRCAMTTRLPAPLGNRAKTCSEPVLTHRFC